MPRQIFNNQVRPTFTSPEQKKELEKMDMFNRPHHPVDTMDAFQQYPIQSQNGAFTEGTQFQIKPPEDGYIKK